MGPLILVGEIAGETTGVNGYNMVRDYVLHRELHDCPGTTMEELWLKNHNPDCEICGGSGKIPGPIFCSNHSICHQEGYMCADCPVLKQVE